MPIPDTGCYHRFDLALEFLWRGHKASDEEGFIFETTGKAFCRLILAHASPLWEKQTGLYRISVFAV